MNNNISISHLQDSIIMNSITERQDAQYVKSFNFGDAACPPSYPNLNDELVNMATQ